MAKRVAAKPVRVWGVVCNEDGRIIDVKAEREQAELSADRRPHRTLGAYRVERVVIRPVRKARTR